MQKNSHINEKSKHPEDPNIKKKQKSVKSPKPPDMT